MKDRISDLLKKYVTIFMNEYSSFLDKDQLLFLKEIDYSKIIKIIDFSMPIGFINYEQICLSSKVLECIPMNKSIDATGLFNNKNYTSYLKAISNRGYDNYQYYADQLMFLVFKLVINNDMGIINGFINYEIKKLQKKYRFQAVNLYTREEVISKHVIDVLGHDICQKIMFMDLPTSFKYINDNLGYRYAKFYEEIINIVDSEFQKISLDNYNVDSSLLKYANDYDHLLYGNAYNYLLDFSINNSL